MAEPNPQRWHEEFQRNGRLVLRTKRGRVALLLRVAIAFTVAGILLIGTGSGASRFWGILAVVLFGVLGIPALGWRLVTGRPVTVVEREAWPSTASDSAGARSSGR